MTIEQDWARERNGLKKSIKAMATRCKQASSCISLMGSEKDHIIKAGRSLESAIFEWDNRNKYSKRKYLREASK